MDQQTIVPETDAAGSASLEKLERRIQAAIEQLRAARSQQAAANEQLTQLKNLLVEKEQEVEQLRTELAEQRSERQQVRDRIETLLEQIELLDK